MPPAASHNVQRFAEAGLLDPGRLEPGDRQVIDQLSDEEVTVLIGVARRLYESDPTVVRLADLGHGIVRLCVPL